MFNTKREKKISELEKIIADNHSEIAAIVMEPLRDHYPVPGFLERVREIANDIGAVMVFDEITAAMRLITGGAHLTLNIEPDIAVFAKAISNGYPMAAIIGRESVMQSAQSTFISSTYWTERIGPVAALATIRKHKRLKVAEMLIQVGKKIQTGWNKAGHRAGLRVNVGGMLPLSHFSFEYENDQAMMTLFTQLMLDEGFLASSKFYANYAHQEEHVKSYLKAVERVFAIIADAQQKGIVERQLNGPIAHSGFQRLT